MLREEFIISFVELVQVDFVGYEELVEDLGGFFYVKIQFVGWDGVFVKVFELFDKVCSL